MNTQVIDLTSEESSSTQRLTSFEASTEAAAVTPDTSGDAALARRLARKESARAKPNGDAPDTSGDADPRPSRAGPADTAATRTSRPNSRARPRGHERRRGARRASRARRTAPRAAAAYAAAGRPRRPHGRRGAGEAPRRPRRPHGGRRGAGEAPRRRGRREETRVEPAPVAALGAIRRLLGADPADWRGPTKPSGSPQPDGWSCGYRCLQTLVFALRRAGAEYGTALASAGLAEPAASRRSPPSRRRSSAAGPAASTPRARSRRETGCAGAFRSWARASGSAAARRASRCGSAGVRADVRGSTGGATADARRLVTYLADYFKNVVGVGSDGVGRVVPAAGARLLRPTTCCVVGVSRDRLVLLDPKWREPRLHVLTPADLARHARQWECGSCGRASPRVAADGARRSGLDDIVVCVY